MHADLIDWETAADDLGRGEVRAHRSIPAPLFILAPPRSFTSVVCAMLGQHPEMYGLLETHLFNIPTVGRWWTRKRKDGLLRCVAELFFHAQTEEAVRQARGWLRRRSHFTTAYLFELIAQRVAPRAVIDKSPSLVYNLASLRRTNRMFPDARYLHLLRHPRGHGESIMKNVRKAAEKGRDPQQWLQRLAYFPPPGHGTQIVATEPEGDPQWGWYTLNSNVIQFLEEIPQERKMTVRAEELLSDPDQHLVAISRWLGVRANRDALEQMNHPERGPYSFVGPPNARFGASKFFLEQPALRKDRVEPLSLDGPLPWREDGGEFSPRVKRLAVQLGYT